MSPLTVLAWVGVTILALPLLGAALLAAVVCWCTAREHVAATRAKITEAETIAAFRAELDAWDGADW